MNQAVPDSNLCRDNQPQPPNVIIPLLPQNPNFFMSYDAKIV